MTKHDLKELAAIGAELGAAKAENERLRGLLEELHPYVRGCSSELWDRYHAALSRQADPCVFHDSDREACQQYSGQVPCEPAPAQDEREAFKRALHSQKVFKLSSATIDAAEWAWFSRPAQTEQQPIRLPQRADTSHGDAFDTQLAEAYNAALDEVTRLNAAPIAQTAPQSDCEWCAGAGKDHFGEKCGHCHAAPQPEQSGLVGQVCGGDSQHNTVNVAVVGTVPWNDLPLGTPVRLIRAPALSAQGAGDADS